MTSPIFIGPNLVIDYFTLPGVTPIQPPPELWWSSRERKAVDMDGLGTSEYLELDFGRLRSLNFLAFDILQKPITVTLEYDVWAFDTGIKYWVPVTPLANERFDDFISYSPNSVNPWKNSQFYFTNVKGDMISARYLRLKFERRDEPWPNGDAQNTFPWSIDVKNLRTSRYVTNLNDTRGVLVQQGKVTSPIVDPVHYDDTTTTVPKVIGIPSGTDIHHIPQGHDGETYFAYMVSNDGAGIYAAGDGTGGMTAQPNVNGQMVYENNSGGSNLTGPTILMANEYTDVNEAGHAVSDLPGFANGWAFFFPHPADTESFAWMIAMGTSASAGVNTTTILDANRNAENSVSVANTGNNFSPPPAGTVMVYTLIVGNSETILSDAALLADGWTLQLLDTAAFASHGFTLYFYVKVATGSEGGSYHYPNVTFTAATKYSAHFSYLGTPSDPTGTVYVMDSGQPINDPTPAGLTNGLRFTSTQHGV